MNTNKPDHQSSNTSYLKSSYNRQSGNKTLILVGILITLITILSISSIILLSQKPKVLIKSINTQPTNR